jgi:hypothetical protein
LVNSGYGLLPKISEGIIDFIRPCILQNFRDPTKVKDDYHFLNSFEDYASYYKAHEKRSVSEISLAKVSFLDMKDIPLEPLRLKITMNTYWRSFRLPIWVKEKSGSPYVDLFQLLPLSASIPTVNAIKADGKSMKVSTFALLFPFGICCVNMRILIKNISMNELIKLIPALHKSTIYNKTGDLNFRKFAFHFSRGLDECLFLEGSHVKALDVHTIIFLRTTQSLYYDSENFSVGRLNAYAIAALMSGETTLSKSIDQVKLILKQKGKGTQDGEILLFNWELGTSLIYPSPLYTSRLTEEKGEDEPKRKTECMCNNYHSFLNVILAVNACLEYKNTPSNKIDYLNRCFCNTFVRDALTKKKKGAYYFKSRFDPIATEIGLKDRLTRICQTI